ncbi:kinetochore protein SLK19-like isoform X2 [Sipha flava]|uniref:Kinetochore protein SLK19-like isoform X2 n=1 Tax=Sipha flava TaxID=143950 RepID=A0A8B8FZS5_9HEMI|nr:kinetochore protein SLK19-like isoform X2 [Sipha flava]
MQPGYGFALIKGSIVVHGTLMNKRLETKIIPGNNNVLKFASEIVWSMDNTTLKELKMSNASIRIDCYNIPNNKFNANIRLGYLMLKVKEAQTMNPTSNDRIEVKSYKLLGSKNCSYNLKMSLYIEDFNVKDVEALSKNNQNLKITENNCINDYNNYPKKDEKNKFIKENIEINLQNDDVNKSENIEIDIKNSDISTSELIENFREKNEPPNVFNFDMQEKLKKKRNEELEHWKKEQMILFNENLKIKEEELFKQFNNKWLEERKHIEEELTQAVSTCKALTENVDVLADMVVEKDAIVTAKELEFSNHRESMDNKYISLVQKCQSSNAQIINELSDKNTQLETRLHDLEKTNILLRNENEQLKEYINLTCDLRVKHLEKTISNLENKYEEANKSCMLFKERWIASVRKINQMYTKLHDIKTNEHLVNNKQNIKNILSNNLVEQKQDEEKLKTLLIDLRKLRQDMMNSNYLDLLPISK